MSCTSLRLEHKQCLVLHYLPLLPFIPVSVNPHTHSSAGKVTCSKGKIQCPFCQGPHSASLCEKVKDLQQRTAIVRQERLCFNCLGHHKISSCNSKHRCHYCQRKHHTSLCTSRQQQIDPATPEQSDTVATLTQQQHGDTPQSQQQRSNTVRLQYNPSAIPTQPQSNDTSSFSVTVPLQQSNICLLKTAIGTVVHGSRNAEAKILLDEGSQ